MSGALIEQEIRALVHRYAAAADARDSEAFAAVFCDDGLLVTPRGELRGRAEIATVTDRLSRYDQTRHVITAHELTWLGDDEATAQTWCTAEHLMIGEVCVDVYEMEIRYDDRYRRVAGEWKIAERVLVVVAEDRRQG